MVGNEELHCRDLYLVAWFGGSGVYIPDATHGTAIYADQLGWCQGVDVGIYGSPMECLGMFFFPELFKSLHEKPLSRFLRSLMFLTN